MIFTCITIDDDLGASFQINECIKEIPQLRLIESFNSALDAINWFQQGNAVDLVFSDIEMEGLDGISAAYDLHKHAEFLIYVTAYPDYRQPAIDECIDGFLMKPVMTADLYERVKKLEQLRLAKSGSTNALAGPRFFKGNKKGEYYNHPLEEIMYFEVKGDYLRMVKLNKQSVIVHMTMKEMEHRVAATKLFIRISQSYLVASRLVHKVDGNLMILKDKTEIIIGKTYRKKVHALLGTA